MATIAGRVDFAVNSVVLQLRDGTLRPYGERGGTSQIHWTLARDEYIVIVEHGRRETFLGSTIVFYTSAGRVLQLRGVEASRSKRFIVPRGKQICGLHFEESILCGVQTCPSAGGLAWQRFVRIPETSPGTVQKIEQVHGSDLAGFEGTANLFAGRTTDRSRTDLLTPHASTDGK